MALPLQKLAALEKPCNIQVQIGTSDIHTATILAMVGFSREERALQPTLRILHYMRLSLMLKYLE